MGKRNLNRVAICFLSATLGLGFQNCAPHEFQNLASNVASSTGVATAGGPTVDPTSVPTALPTPTTPVVVCDPFSSGSSCSQTATSGPGLMGSLWYLPNGQVLNDYFTRGTEENVLIQLTQINVPERSFDSGFPTSNGVLQTPNGDVLTEYFALDMNGYLTLANETAGSYQFALNSDDGSTLSIDGQMIINDDGTHAQVWKCSTTSVNLQRGVKHVMKLDYFQGPRNDIALQLYWRQGNSSSCDQNDSSWQIVPADVLSH